MDFWLILMEVGFFWTSDSENILNGKRGRKPRWGLLAKSVWCPYSLNIKVNGTAQASVFFFQRVRNVCKH